MLWEIKQFYPKEYQVSERVLAFLNKELSIELPEEEAGNIAFHLVNAQSGQKDMGNTILGIKMQKNIFNIIQMTFQKKLDVNSMNYTRLVIHIQFFLQRLFEDKMLDDQGVMFYEHIKEKPVSYTHLDVYKRQPPWFLISAGSSFLLHTWK